MVFERLGVASGAGRARGRRQAGARLRRRPDGGGSRDRSRVIGPESAVKRVSEAITEPVSVADAREPVTEEVTVGLLNFDAPAEEPRRVR